MSHAAQGRTRAGVERADVVIVGGGVVGSSTALHLRRDGFRGRVVVVERDPTYRRASSSLATGGFRQQYASSLNVQMARFSLEFYKRFDTELRTPAHSPNVWLRQRGYLFLANDTNAARLETRFVRMRQAGANVERWDVGRIRQALPDAMLDDIEFAIFGPEDGYFEPREVLAGTRAAAEYAGAEYVAAEVVGVERSGGCASGVVVRQGDGGGSEWTIEAPVVVNAAGTWASQIAAMAGITIPIFPVRQTSFRAALPRTWPYRFPMVFDPDGTHWRHDDARSPADADRIVLGRSKMEELPGENFEAEGKRFEEELAPSLYRRVPAMKPLEVVECWAGLYEMTPDEDALLGEHPALPGFMVAAGFSGHGVMMAPATGAAVSQLIREGQCTLFDIAPLAPDRFERGQLFRDDALI